MHVQAYEQSIAALEMELTEASKEQTRLTGLLAVSSTASDGKAADSLSLVDLRVKTLKAKKAALKAMPMTDDKAARLCQEISVMKAAKVSLLNRIRDEATRFR